jgi:kynurenine formamidase
VLGKPIEHKGKALPNRIDVVGCDFHKTDSSLAKSFDVHAKVVRWYRWCGYVLNEVTRLPAAQRAGYALSILAQSTGPSVGPVEGE